MVVTVAERATTTSAAQCKTREQSALVSPRPATAPRTDRRVVNAADAGDGGAMSRGPTRRVHRLIESGAVADKLLQAAAHQADLLGHPYIGVEDLELGRLRMEGRTVEYEAVRQHLHVDLPRRWWRPRGPARHYAAAANDRPRTHAWQPRAGNTTATPILSSRSPCGAGCDGGEPSCGQ
jgi:hypothetical protein